MLLVKNYIENKKLHVIILNKKSLSTRHLERSETKSKDLNYCLFVSNSISERNPNKLLM